MDRKAYEDCKNNREEAKKPENKEDIKAFQDNPDNYSSLESILDEKFSKKDNREREYCQAIKILMRRVKHGHSESFNIQIAESDEPHIKMITIKVIFESDPEIPYLTRQIKCYIESSKEGVSRK